MPQLSRYQGNCPSLVSKDAKYSVRSRGNAAVIALTYRAADGEHWHAATESHAELVEMVNAVKLAVSGRPHGPFYINEYRQVLVPTGAEGAYYLAGEYHGRLQFDFEGRVLSGDACDLEGRRIVPGDLWVGPHPGIPYVLKAGVDEICYEMSPRPNVTKVVRLSGYVGRDRATEIARRVRATKGYQGGRFYVNEWRQMFAPRTSATNVEFLYIGELHLDEGWFPKWEPPLSD